MLRNCADNVGVVIRNMKKEQQVSEGERDESDASEEWDTLVAIEKDREEGQVKAFKYKYDWKISRYELIQKAPFQVENIYSGHRNGSSKKFQKR